MMIATTVVANRAPAMTPPIYLAFPCLPVTCGPWYVAGMASAQAPKDLAFRQGRAASRITGPDSQMVYNPYDADDEPDLYEAWDDGFNDDSDTRSEMIHFGA